MRALVITLDDDLFEKLNRLMTHKGERAFLIRKAIKRLVKELEEAKYGKDSSAGRTSAG